MRLHCTSYVIALSTAWLNACVLRLNAEETAFSSPVAAVSAAEPDSIRQLEAIVTSMARTHIPHTYEDLDDWGRQSERWDGLKVHLDGLRVKTKRRKKLVNDGTWKLYRVSLHDPNQEFEIQLTNLHKSNSGRMAFDIQVTARLHVHGRVAQWVKGVQLFSVSADAIARVRLTARIEVGLYLAVTELPPSIGILPKVQQADVALVDFKMYRVSDVGGEIAQQIGRGAESIIEKRLAKERPKLAAKLNTALDKKQGKLRISPKELFASKWGEYAKQQLSEASAATQAAED